MKYRKAWFLAVSAIMMAFGLLYGVAGLKILPVRPESLADWEGSIYGAMMIGWGSMLFLVGRLAFARRDGALIGMSLFGLGLWLAFEALLSLVHGVYFNAGVDVAVFALFAIPAFGAMAEWAGRDGGPAPRGRLSDRPKRGKSRRLP